MRKMRGISVPTLVLLALVLGASGSTFRDCYTKCFIFCMIEPSQAICSCSTSCLKNCIFLDAKTDLRRDQTTTRNLKFCELGCAFSSCSGISSKAKPNVDEMEGCVGSCSTMCNISYSSSP